MEPWTNLLLKVLVFRIDIFIVYPNYQKMPKNNRKIKQHIATCMPCNKYANRIILIATNKNVVTDIMVLVWRSLNIYMSVLAQ